MRNFLTVCAQFKPSRQGKPGFNSGDMDNKVMNRFFAHTEESSTNLADDQLYIFNFQGVHLPYGWLEKEKMDLEYVQHYPFNFHMPSKLTFSSGKQDENDRTAIINSYRNSIRSIDYQFWRLISFLKKKELYDRSTILLFSDHGESLLDNPDETKNSIGHGFLPFRNQSENLESGKFSEHG